MVDDRTRLVDDRRERNEHQVVITRREDLRIEGVENVESFDDQEIMVETVGGGLLVRGTELHISQFNLDSGTLLVHGYIDAVEYLGESLTKKGKGIIGRLFK